MVIQLAEQEIIRIVGYKMIKEYDVIVVGAGFGGPVAAKKCAEAGLKTLMIERSKNVGDKVVSGLTIPFYGFLFGPAFIRDGNPPFERPADGIINYIITDIEKEEMEIDDSLILPKPLSPIIAFGYNTYCKPFCEWEAKQAVKSGVELKTSTTVIDFLKEGDYIIGIVTDKGETFKSKIVINAEGSQGLLSIKAGIRDKYPPEAISLADTYDYVIPKKAVDRIFGYTSRFCWGWDEQKIAPPLGYGNGLMVWPYRNSIHFMQDQCLSLGEGKVPNLNKLFDIYHKNITNISWWRNGVAPFIKLRARLWEGFEIYVGLDKKLRNFHNFTDGMILIGDAAGLESTELCDGVPAAWYSAEIAADIAIEAIKINDMSKIFLKKYNEKIKAHPIIQWSISGTNRYNLRIAQKEHDEKKLKKYIHDGWGLGALTHFMTPLLKTVILYVKEEENILSKWIKMYFRYFQNWLYESYGDSVKIRHKNKTSRGSRLFDFIFRVSTRMMDSMSMMLRRLINRFEPMVNYFIDRANIFMKKILRVVEPFYLRLNRLLKPVTEQLSQKLIDYVEQANPKIFV
ncbi:MAG: NAD(P)/FAD-dependent oxidoreductase [Candidatus Lokiarchaeota archaeon]|nr:NAD(P)/FAD-dependent oxidoreductase [Candidatus Lokiarchaeota archaeon]